jgi:carboxyl-terminal processing protease
MSNQESQSTYTKSQTWLPLFIALALAIGMFIGQKLPRYDQNFKILNSRTGGAFDEILAYIDARYVDSVDTGKLREEAINKLLSNLDPHSVYFTAEERKAIDDDMQGSFDGVGIEYLMVQDTMVVVQTLPGGPSEKAGILGGDKIVMIGETNIAGIKVSSSETLKLLRGPKGTPVKIGVLRGNDKNLRYFTVERDKIAVKSVEVATMLNERTGYIKISQFTANTYQEFMEGLRPLMEEKGMQDLVLDLRGNPGGYMEEATELLGQIFPAGKLLVYTKSRGNERVDYKSEGRARFNIQNIAVLIDENSASASEIVAGAVQDHDRGWVIGRRSFGKGLVQDQYPLSDEGALRLTVSRYYTPSGRCIQRDYKNGDYDHEAERRLKNGELNDASKVKQADSSKYYTGLGRIVYGGGGITPDIFIPIDSSFANTYFNALRYRIPQFVSKWMENTDKNSFPASLSEYVKNFSVDDAVLDQLAAYAEKDGVARNPAQLAPARQELRLMIKARIAKLLFRDEGLFAVLNDDDPAIEMALKVMRNPLK